MTIRAAETFHPGEILKVELAARGWSQTEFAEIIDRPSKLVNQLISGKSGITPETAQQLSNALGTTPDFWLNLQTQYQVSRLKQEDDTVQRKAFLHSNFPIREMVKRGWLSASNNIDELEKNVKDFFKLDDLNEHPVFAHAAKKSSYTDPVKTSHIAWLLQAEKLANQQVIKKYSKQKLQTALTDLSSLLSAPEEVRHAQKILNENGVRLLFVEALPDSKIDGACFWLDKDKPVIVLSLRLDRIDNFWFVLRHEIEHILQEDHKAKYVLDEDITSKGSESNLPEEEVRANKAAAEFCVPQSQLENYILRNQPFVFTELKVQGFANRLKIHPGLIVGQLHHKTGDYKMLRKHLVKVRNILLESSPHNGWYK